MSHKAGLPSEVRRGWADWGSPSPDPGLGGVSIPVYPRPSFLPGRSRWGAGRGAGRQWRHSRQVGRAPLEFGSLPEAVEGGEDHAREQLLDHLPGTSQAMSVLPLPSLRRVPSAEPHRPTFRPPPPPRKRSHPDPVSEDSSGHSPARSFRFQLGELQTYSRFCSSPRTCNSQGHRDQQKGGILASPVAARRTPSSSGAQPDALSIEGHLHFTGGEGCLEVEAKGLGREDVLPLLARGLYQHLRGVRRLLPQLLLGVLQLLAHPAAGCQSRERTLGGKSLSGSELWGRGILTPEASQDKRRSTAKGPLPSP